MSSLTLKQLRYFEALARHGNFGRAAEDVAISQPALSLQIKELEALFGAPLVERGARRARLTPLGDKVLGKAREVLRAVSELDDLARAAGDALAGRLRIGVIPTIAPYLLPGMIRVLAAEFPDLELKLREAITETVLGDLRDGQLDAALVALPVSEPSLHEVPLFDEEFVLVRPAGEAGAPVPGPAGLRQMRLLLLEEGHCFRDQALSFCEASGGEPREMMEGSSLSTLVQMVGAGLGVTLIPEMAISQETRSAEVAVAHFAAPAPARQIGLVWRKTTPLAGSLNDIAAALRAAGPSLAPRF